jgi:NADPH:quinone reductase
MAHGRDRRARDGLSSAQVLVRIHAVGINPVDTYLRSNTDNRGPKLPYTPGSDTAGVVEVVGSGVTQVKAGDRVYVGGTLSGAYAEFCLCSPNQVHPLPANATFAQGAAMNVPYATAYQALFNRADGRAGETVLVHGASGDVSIAASQLARARGLTVIGTAGTERGRKRVLAEGAHHVVDHTAPGYLRNACGTRAARGRNHNGDAGHREPSEGPRHYRRERPHCRHRQPRPSPLELAGIHAALVEGLRNSPLRPVIAQGPAAKSGRAQPRGDHGAGAPRGAVRRRRSGSHRRSIAGRNDLPAPGIFPHNERN